jgi:5-methylcytosine-specific restriction protein A
MIKPGHGNSDFIRKRYLKSHVNICSICGYSGYLEVHHIKPVIDGGCNEDDNLTLLCEVCHGLAHGKNNKKNYLDLNRKYWSKNG